MDQSEKKISPKDIEAKLRELQGGLDRAKETARPALNSIGAVAVTAAVVVIFLIGVKFGRRKNAVVEVRRI